MLGTQIRSAVLLSGLRTEELDVFTMILGCGEVAFGGPVARPWCLLSLVLAPQPVLTPRVWTVRLLTAALACSFVL